MSDHGRARTLLVVDDEENVADSYAIQLRDEYEQILTAYGAAEAVEAVEANDVDVILLDRRMPTVSGDKALTQIRETDPACRVVMVTAVNPDFDILEMPFDDYLQKPIDKPDLIAAIDQQLRAKEFDTDLERYFAASSKIAVLEADKSASELAEHSKYQSLKEERDRLESKLDEQMAAFDDVVEGFSSIDRT
jgi:DNA-binding response OmpR family regulator